MPTLTEIREQFPQYADMPDDVLADALHRKFYSDIPREEFDAKIGLLKESPVRAEVRKEIAADRAKGIPTGDYGLLRLAVQGTTLGGADEAIAGMATPIEMFRRRTLNPAKAYEYAKAREDLLLEEARKNAGLAGNVAEIGGGVVSGIGLARAGLALAPRAGLLGKAGVGATEGAAYGATSGFLDGGNSLEDRLGGAARGGVAGGLVGGAIPIATMLAAPVVSSARAAINPRGMAESQFGRAISESDRPVTSVVDDIAQAAREGQGEYTVSDALGNAGQRMLGTVARAPGAGRQQVIEFLEGRQAGQGERIATAIDQGLMTGPTARQTRESLIKQAQREADPYYKVALSEQPVWSERMQAFFDDPVTKSGIKEGLAVQRLEALAKGEKFNPNDFAVTGFNEAGDPVLSAVPNMRTINIIKKGFDSMLEKYREPVTGRLVLDEYGRALDSVRRAFLEEVDALNPAYAKARSVWAGPASVREQVPMGQKAVVRGRAEDNISQYLKLTPAQQAGYRSGYSDKLQEGIERAAVGVDKSRPFTSPKRRAELEALTQYNGPYRPGDVDPLQRQLGRERVMFETRRQATGGSSTADNLADQAAMRVDPTFISALMTGNYTGAAGNLLRNAMTNLSGYTPAVREELAKLLLMRGEGADIAGIMNRIAADAEKRQKLAAALTRGLLGGQAVGVTSAGR